MSTFAEVDARSQENRTAILELQTQFLALMTNTIPAQWVSIDDPGDKTGLLCYGIHPGINNGLLFLGWHSTVANPSQDSHFDIKGYAK